MLPSIYSIKAIEKQYGTGEEPVLVMCSDMNAYVCKYMRSTATTYKLACELIGSHLAKAWRLKTPEIALVRIKPEHWAGRIVQHNISAPAIGSRWLNGVLDITPSTLCEVRPGGASLQQLLKIALFDFWIANEDRNANNANLLYDIERECLVSIDYGCILNTATFEYPMSQLTSTDTILWSDLFCHINQGISQTTLTHMVGKLKTLYTALVKNSAREVDCILAAIPEQWKIPADVVKRKLLQLFDEAWVEGVWDNFMECLKENTEDE